MRITVIVNPIAGRSRSRRRLFPLLNCLQSRGHHIDLHVTLHPSHARLLAAHLQDQTDCFLVAAGDGTVHDLVNGLSDPSRTPIAIFPLGTANVLAREFHIPRTPDAFIPLIENRSTRPLRLALAVNADPSAETSSCSRRFLLMASTGFDAAVVHAVAARRRRSLGFLPYLPAIFQTVRSYRNHPVTVQLDDHPPQTAALVIVSSVSNYAGLFRLAPHTDPASDFLQVFLFPRSTPAALARYSLAALLRRLHRLPQVLQLPARRIELSSSAAALPVQIDGDPAGFLPLRIQRLDVSVPVIAPPQT